MTALRPKHAAPCAPAAVRWAPPIQWALFALVSAAAIGAAATAGPSTRQAAADVPAAGASSAVNQPPGFNALVGSRGGSSPASSAPLPSSPAAAAAPAARHDSAQASSLASSGIPATALRAYRDAAAHELAADPACGLPWPLLAGIGRVESDHGRFAGAVLHTDGVSTPRIIGIPLDGGGTARILDTDHGRLDGDTVYDRAVGPMQFIPSTWAGYGADGNGDGRADPFNIFDAAAAAARYLCAAGGDLTTLAGQNHAIRAYNNSDAYITLVLQLEQVYARGVPGLTVPVLPADLSLRGAARQSAVPPANPGPALGVSADPSTQPTSRSTHAGSSPRSTPRTRAGSTSAHDPSLSPVPPTTTTTAPADLSPSPTECPDPSGSSASTASTATPTAATASPCPTDSSPGHSDP